MKGKLLIFLFSFLVVTFVSAVEIGETNIKGVEIILPEPPITNLSLAWVNSSDFWDLLDDPSDILGSLINNDLNWISDYDNVTSTCSAGEVLVDYTCLNLNTSIDLRTISATHNASLIETIEGTLDYGDIGNITIPEDGFSYNVSEDAGASPLLIYINFTGVTNFDSVIGRIYYDGGQGHEIQLEIQRTDTGVWENYIEFTDTTNFINFYIPIFDPENYVDGSNVVAVRFDHAQVGNPAHNFYIDYIALVDGWTTLTVSGHDGLGGRDDKENHPWAMPTDFSRNAEGNLDMNNGSVSFNITNANWGFFENLNASSANVGFLTAINSISMKKTDTQGFIIAFAQNLLNYTFIYHDGTSGVLSANEGNLVLIPETGHYIVAAGSGLVPISDGLALGISGLEFGTAYINQIKSDNGTVGFDDENITSTGTIIATTISDGTFSVTGGEFIDVGSITGDNMDLNGGTGDITTSGIITDGVVSISDGEFTDVVSITGANMDVNAGTGDILTSGILEAGATTIIGDLTTNLSTGDYNEFRISTALTTGQPEVLKIIHETSGNMTDVFGTKIGFYIQDPGATEEIGAFLFTRGDADDTGKMGINMVKQGTPFSVLFADMGISGKVDLVAPIGTLNLDSTQGGINIDADGASSKITLEAGTAGIVSNTVYLDTTTSSPNLYISSEGGGKFKRQTSSLRYKTNVTDLERNNSLFYNLRPVSFNSLMEGDDPNKRFAGLIAEEVCETVPEACVLNEKGEPESYEFLYILAMITNEVQKHEDWKTIRENCELSSDSWDEYKLCVGEDPSP